jgi:hypothetical protein
MCAHLLYAFDISPSERIKITTIKKLSLGNSPKKKIIEEIVSFLLVYRICVLKNKENSNIIV